ncbi:uncharacterized protein LOC130362075 isoform X2 [Hyla sarda]|uniref:uncharacterized protein LOC130362075 isoform X2 n=1 Tax=Hyla sarda TaxID=327740 RepID=UPI0024C42D35|nr:uncharacterized protein LOC130362075 isoform X2 [Hyla sarda]
MSTEDEQLLSPYAAQWSLLIRFIIFSSRLPFPIFSFSRFIIFSSRPPFPIFSFSRCEGREDTNGARILSTYILTFGVGQCGDHGRNYQGPHCSSHQV